MRARGVDPLAVDESVTVALRGLAVGGWEIGTASALFVALEAVVEPTGLPRDAAKLMEVLGRSTGVLEDAGVRVSRHKVQGRKLVQLTAVSPAPSPPVKEPSDSTVVGRVPARGRVASDPRRDGAMRYRADEERPENIPEWVWRAVNG